MPRDEILLRYARDGRVTAIGCTRFDPEPHVLCEGSEDEVLTILVSIYGWKPSTGFRLRYMLRREYEESE